MTIDTRKTTKLKTRHSKQINAWQKTIRTKKQTQCQDNLLSYQALKLTGKRKGTVRQNWFDFSEKQHSTIQTHISSRPEDYKHQQHTGLILSEFVLMTFQWIQTSVRTQQQYKPSHSMESIVVTNKPAKRKLIVLNKNPKILGRKKNWRQFQLWREHHRNLKLCEKSSATMQLSEGGFFSAVWPANNNTLPNPNVQHQTSSPLQSQLRRENPCRPSKTKNLKGWKDYCSSCDERNQPRNRQMLLVSLFSFICNINPCQSPLEVNFRKKSYLDFYD